MSKRNNPGTVVQAAREHGFLLRANDLKQWTTPDGKRRFSHAAVHANIIAGTLRVTYWLGMPGKGGMPYTVVPTGVDSRGTGKPKEDPSPMRIADPVLRKQVAVIMENARRWMPKREEDPSPISRGCVRVIATERNSK